MIDHTGNDLDPLDHWLRGGPCPSWCPQECAYNLEGDGITYSRLHTRPMAVPGERNHLTVTLCQYETTTDPASPTTSLAEAEVTIHLSGDESLGSAARASHSLRLLAVGLLTTAVALNRITGPDTSPKPEED